MQKYLDLIQHALPFLIGNLLILAVTALMLFVLSNIFSLSRQGLGRAVAVVALNALWLPILTFVFSFIDFATAKNVMSSINPIVTLPVGLFTLIILVKVFYRASWLRAGAVALLAWVSGMVAWVVIALVYMGTGLL